MSQALWQRLSHLPQGNNEFQTTSIQQKSTWVKYRGIQTIDELKLLGLLHLNEKKSGGGLSASARSSRELWRKAGVDRSCERSRSFELWKTLLLRTRPEGPPVGVVNVDSQCEILSVFTWVRMIKNWFDETYLSTVNSLKPGLESHSFFLYLMIYTEKKIPYMIPRPHQNPIHRMQYKWRCDD